MKNHWPPVILGLLCLGVAGLLWSIKPSTDPQRTAMLTAKLREGSRPPIPDLAQAQATLAPAAPSPTPLPEELRKAREYYDAHMARMQQIANVEYPHAIAHRKDDPRRESALQFGNEHLKTLLKRYPLSADAEEKTRGFFDRQRTREEADKENPFIFGIGVTSNAVLYGEMLGDSTNLGAVTVAEMTRELLGTPAGAEDARKLLAIIERRIRNDETIAKRIEALNGPELADYLKNSQVRYQGFRDKLAEAAPFTPEQSASIDRAGWYKMVGRLAKLYEAQHDAGYNNLRKEYYGLEGPLRDMLLHILDDTPERREMHTALYEVMAKMKQLDHRE